MPYARGCNGSPFTGPGQSWRPAPGGIERHCRLPDPRSSPAQPGRWAGWCRVRHCGRSRRPRSAPARDRLALTALCRPLCRSRASGVLSHRTARSQPWLPVRVDSRAGVSPLTPQWGSSPMAEGNAAIGSGPEEGPGDPAWGADGAVPLGDGPCDQQDPMPRRGSVIDHLPQMLARASRQSARPAVKVGRTAIRSGLRAEPEGPCPSGRGSLLMEPGGALPRPPESDHSAVSLPGALPLVLGAVMMAAAKPRGAGGADVSEAASSSASLLSSPRRMARAPSISFPSLSRTM